jgi:hypothetical protein
MVNIQITNEEYEMLKEMRHLLKTQDNRITANPIYGIMKKVKVWGKDSSYADEYEWYHDCETYNDEDIKECLLDELDSFTEWYSAEYDDVTEEEAEKIIQEADQSILADFAKDYLGFEKVYYTIEEEIHHNSFSLFEADAYTHLATNGHNIGGGKKYTYVFSNFRTPRMNKLRKFLLSMSCFGIHASDVHRSVV